MSRKKFCRSMLVRAVAVSGGLVVLAGSMPAPVQAQDATTQPSTQPTTQRNSGKFKLFVGNLPWSISDAQLVELFTPYGKVESAKVMTDRDSGRSRGWGLVDIDTEDFARIIREVNGREIDGRQIRVAEDEKKEERPTRPSRW